MCITRILKNSFLCMGIILGVSHIYAVELNSTNITQAPFNCAVIDTTCSLGFKGITSIAPGTFDNHSNLTILDLTNNQLTSLPAGLFDYTPNLSQFAIYANQLTSLPAGLFDYTPNLNYFSPAINQLTSLPAGLFNNTPNLSNFNIAFNSLTTLPDDLFANLSSFGLLRLDNNKLINIPTSLLAITGVSNFRIGQNCLSVNDLPFNTINYLNTYSVDSPIWSLLQDNCSVEFSLNFDFLVNPIFPGLQNVLNITINQGTSNPSSGNYIDFFGLSDFMSIDLNNNPSWNLLAGDIYRYILPDYSGNVSQTIQLTGNILPTQGGSSMSFAGKIVTSTREIATGNNLLMKNFYVFPITDYILTGLINTGYGQSGDIKTINLNYSPINPNYYSGDSIIQLNLGSGVSLSSMGEWKTSSASGELFYSGDVCYTALRDKNGPYYQDIYNKVRSLGYNSLNDWLTYNYGLSSNPTEEIENLEYICLLNGYSSLSDACLFNQFGLSFSNEKYPQCGGEKSFLLPEDICYADFIEETGVYYQTIESIILNSFGMSLDQLLQSWFGFPSDPNHASENLISACTDDNYFGFPNLKTCLSSFLGFNATDYDNSCGAIHSNILFAKVLTPFSGSIDIDILLNKNITINESVVPLFKLYPSILDNNYTNNEFYYTLTTAPIQVNEATGSFGGGGGVLINTGFDQIGFLETDIYNDSIDNGYCYKRKSGLSVIDSLSIETTEEFKKALLFMYSYDLTKNSSINDYNPYINLTREQAAKMFANFATNVLCRKINSSLTISYNDFGLADASLQSYITKAFQLGLMKGGNDGNFRPKDFITKAEFNAVMIRMILKTYLPEDRSDIWYSEYNKISKSLGIVKYGAGSRSLKKNDAALMLFRTYKNHSFSLQNINYNSYVLSNRNNILPLYDEVTVDQIISNSGASGNITILSGTINNSPLFSGSSHSLVKQNDSDVVFYDSGSSVAINKQQIIENSLYSGSYSNFDGGL